ncbi:MAG: universal stress protein [Actinobacteria bacterium]|nr:universal stress protein [Actinomycetota bacterium]
MYKKMVVLLDGSKLAEVVFDYAQELSGRLGIDVGLLHVCRPEEAAQLPMRRAYIEQMAALLCASAEQVRAKYQGDSAECIQAHGHVAVGYPAQRILEYVDENDIDLVVMSTHGSSGEKVWDIGEVANKVIHASKVPVWLVPTELRGEVISDSVPNRSTLVPLSGSKSSEGAIRHAVDLLQHRGVQGSGELVLLHVGVEDRLAEAKEYLEGLARPLRDSGLAVRTEALRGEPDKTIISYLKDNPTQLIVMATRGKSRISRRIFGSVTESVIHMVKVTPLLLISGEE